eukprot:CAMPEP_0119024156 /NCGR_PEP_ID=MMETSP1176-20130426/31345_1 /TAXON_ID=265551 /ORGANISM="Synedropsis recta cf, Strain CCMP1620" /LENGTH=106 /DNA_ID=CAMNT_0006979373 /DNA_START=27 /DNA_END=343 /DNA_ORIENTATION=-
MVKLERKRARGYAFTANKLVTGIGLAIMVVLYKEYLSTFSAIQAVSYFDTTIPSNVTSVVSLNSQLVDKKILVAYSGPTSLERSKGKNELYLRNLDFFLKHGVDCR